MTGVRVAVIVLALSVLTASCADSAKTPTDGVDAGSSNDAGEGESVCGVPVVQAGAFELPGARQPAEELEVPSGSSAAIRFRFPADTAATPMTVWLPAEGALDVDVGIALGASHPASAGDAGISVLLDGKKVGARTATIRRGAWETSSFHVPTEAIPMGGSLLSMIVSAPVAGRPFGRSIVVFRGSYRFAAHELAATAVAAEPSDASSIVQSDGSQAITVKRKPTAGGALEVQTRLRGVDADWTNCGGQTSAVIALLDGAPVAFADGTDALFVHLESEAERVDLPVRFAALPTTAGHRVELVAIGGIGRPFEFPLGKMTPWMDANPFAFAKVEW